MTNKCSWTSCFSQGTKNGDKQLTITGLVLVDGHTDVTLRHDQEHALGALARLITERRGHSTYLELA